EVAPHADLGDGVGDNADPEQARADEGAGRDPALAPVIGPVAPVAAVDDPGAGGEAERAGAGERGERAEGQVRLRVADAIGDRALEIGARADPGAGALDDADPGDVGGEAEAAGDARGDAQADAAPARALRRRGWIGPG